MLTRQLLAWHGWFGSFTVLFPTPLLILSLPLLSPGYSDEAVGEEYYYEDYSECAPTKLECESDTHIAYTAQCYNTTAAKVRSSWTAAHVAADSVN
jgi:hypothetical protein